MSTINPHRLYCQTASQVHYFLDALCMCPGSGERWKRVERNIKNKPHLGDSFLLRALHLLRHLAADKMILPLNTRKLHPVSQSPASITPNRSPDFPPRQIWNSICVMPWMQRINLQSFIMTIQGREKSYLISPSLRGKQQGEKTYHLNPIAKFSNFSSKIHTLVESSE